jgi:hypothetical protein
MLYRPPEPETYGRLQDVALVFGLVALGIVTTAGAVWAVFQVGGVIPLKVEVSMMQDKDPTDHCCQSYKDCDVH